MENVIFVKKYPNDDTLFPLNKKEVCRYAGYSKLLESDDEMIGKMLDGVIDECKGVLSYKVCYRRVELTWEDGIPKLPLDIHSKNLAAHLDGCSEVIIFAATIGLGIDRMIAKYQRISPTKALLLQAYGAERVEKLCDVFCEEIENSVKNEGLYCTSRYSPGYGDLPLEVQREVFTLLDCNRQIGISLSESLLMTPSKSVTAIFGLSKNDSEKNKHKCHKCGMKDCVYRH